MNINSQLKGKSLSSGVVNNNFISGKFVHLQSHVMLVRRLNVGQE